MGQKVKVFAYLMGKEDENNSLIRAIEYMTDPTNTIKDIIDFLYESSRLKTRSVQVSLKQNGTKMIESLTVKDIASMVQDQGQDDINLYVYNAPLNFANNSDVRGEQNCQSIFERVGFPHDQSQPLQENRQPHTPASFKPNITELQTEHVSTNENLVEPQSRGLSKKQSIKQMNKDECCLLI